MYFFFIFFFIFFSFDCDFLSFEQPLQDPASGWKGGVNDFLFLLPSLPFPALSSVAHITWRGEAKGKGGSNAKSLERTVRTFSLIPVSGRNICRNKVQGKEKKNEKIPSIGPRRIQSVDDTPQQLLS